MACSPIIPIGRPVSPYPARSDFPGKHMIVASIVAQWISTPFFRMDTSAAQISGFFQIAGRAPVPLVFLLLQAPAGSSCIPRSAQTNPLASMCTPHSRKRCRRSLRKPPRENIHAVALVPFERVRESPLAPARVPQVPPRNVSSIPGGQSFRARGSRIPHPSRQIDVCT